VVGRHNADIVGTLHIGNVHVEDILPFNNLFFRLLIRALVAKIHPDKVVR